MTIWECQLKPAVRKQTLLEMEYWINYCFCRKFSRKSPKTYETIENPSCIVADIIAEYGEKKK